MHRVRRFLFFVGKRLLFSVAAVGVWVAIGAGLWFFDRAYPNIVPLWLIVLFGLPILFLPWFFLEVILTSLITPDEEASDE